MFDEANSRRSEDSDIEFCGDGDAYLLLLVMFAAHAPSLRFYI